MTGALTVAATQVAGIVVNTSSYDLSGAGLLSAGAETIGGDGGGSFTQSGGSTQ